ncbi:MAG: PrsW family intramembrane metalloprotease [Actinomycetota bacterium]|nr:PrsW family intramembrane metalloprotease [Actinomycetota bacterium]
MTGFGPAAPGSPGIPASHRWVLPPVLGLVVLAVPALIALTFISANIGGVAVLVGTMAAVLPVLLVVAAFLWVDRWEPEPSRLLFAAFLWGAGVSVLGAAFVNDTATVLGEQLFGTGGGDLVASLISAPVVEEAFKGTFLVGLLWLWRREFDGVVDGIVYAGLVAAGFAFTENILYFGRAFVIDGLVGDSGSVVSVFMMRGVLSPFAHPVFTAIIGIAVGLAVRPRNPVRRVLLPFVGYLGAVGLHALWNASAGLGFLPAFYGVIMVPLFGGLIALVLWQRSREQRVVSAALPRFASAGWIAPSEVPLLASQTGRRGWRSEVRRRAGEAAADAVRDYQHAVTELAFLSDRMHRGSAGPETGQWHHEALAALHAARDRAMRAPHHWRG